MGIRQFFFGNVLEKTITIILIVFLFVSFFIIIKNKVDITEKKDREVYFKSLAKFGVGIFKNVARITLYAIKQEWIPKTLNEKNITKNNTTNSSVNKSK